MQRIRHDYMQTEWQNCAVSVNGVYPRRQFNKVRNGKRRDLDEHSCEYSKRRKCKCFLNPKIVGFRRSDLLLGHENAPSEKN